MVLCAGKTVRRTIFCPEPPRTKTLHEGCGCYILSGVRGFVLYSKYLFKIRKKRLSEKIQFFKNSTYYKCNC
ncbi:Uncharacterised protein [uncultured Blautia sp.]|nr:unknown [Roseburia sp. CAG:471]SCJ38144.1 Uncharacterised protein [uncultured Blautia sp.]